MQADLASLHSEVTAQVHAGLTPSTSLVPAGAASFPLPAIDTGPLVTAGINFTLDQLARQFGGLATDYAKSHRAQILAVVPKAVLALAQGVIDELSAGQ